MSDHAPLDITGRVRDVVLALRGLNLNDYVTYRQLERLSGVPMTTLPTVVMKLRIREWLDFRDSNPIGFRLSPYGRAEAAKVSVIDQEKPTTLAALEEEDPVIAAYVRRKMGWDNPARAAETTTAPVDQID